MKKYLKPFLCLAFLLGFSQAQAQFKTWPVVNLLFKNQFDRDGFHHGRWAFMTDDVGEGEQMKTRGRYRHGYMVGRWKTLSAEGTLRKSEQTSFVDGRNLIETIQYHPNGNIESKGVAVLERTGATPRFFLRGEWLYFNPDGSKDRTVDYEEGWPVKTTYADGKVVVSKAPPKSRVYRKGESPSLPRPRVGTTMMEKNGEIILIQYHGNGDSTVTVRPKKVGQ